MKGRKQAQNHPAHLADLLQKAMALQGWTQKELATALGVQQPDISKMHYSPGWNRRYQILQKLIEFCERS